MLLLAAPAKADSVGKRAAQLRTSSDYKVRLSAALWLGKKKEAGAVRALTHALRNDSEKTVRAIAAVSIGKLLDDTLPARVRDDAIDALDHAAQNDDAASVREKAAAAWTATRSLRTPTGTLPTVFIAVGTPSATGGLPAKTASKEMQSAMRRALRDAAPDFGQGTTAEGLPTAADLRKARSSGFYVNAAVQDIQTVKARGGVEVRCQVGMRVNVWNGSDGEERLRENETASALGNGRVRTASTQSAMANASRDCVNAVVEQLTTKQVVPFIKRAIDRRVAQADAD
jgi:hypothetical protein